MLAAFRSQAPTAKGRSSCIAATAPSISKAKPPPPSANDLIFSTMSGRPSFETLASQAPQDEVGDIFHSLERRDPSVSAIALIAAARTLTFEARGDGSLRSQERLVGRGNSICEPLRLRVSPASGFLPCRRIPALCYG